MSEFGDALWNLKFEVRKKLAPVLYRNSFPTEQKTKHEKRFDSLASGLISLIDSDPTEIKRKLGLDEKQMRDLLLLGKLAQEKRLTRKPVELSIKESQRLLSTVYQGSQSQSFDAGNQSLTFALDFLTRSDVRLAVNINAKDNLPVSAGTWGNKGSSHSDTVHFIFLPEKPNSKEHARTGGSYIDLRMSGGAEIGVYGQGERIDFSDTFNDRKGQRMFSMETFLYLGEFESEGDVGKQTIHCWGHNTKIHSKTLPIRQEEKAPVAALQPSKVVV